MSDIKECFVSRWGDDGYLIEVDYKQLEVIGLAFLSQDPMLYKDINDGVDMHSMSAAFLFGEKYETILSAVAAGDPEWIKKRGEAKMPSFLMQYGGKAKGMAMKTGLPVKACQTFIDNYYTRYTKVGEWQDSVEKEVNSGKQISTFTTRAGLPAMTGSYSSVTGRVYHFKQVDSFKKGKGSTDFHQPHMKNYPVQGFAADIVMCMLGVLHRKIKESSIKDKLLIVNTVHDSIILDCHKDVLDIALRSIKAIMEATPYFLHKVYKIKFDLPLRVDIEYGKNWKSLTTYTE